MLSADVRFEGFTTTDWSRLLGLFRPRRTTGAERDPDRPRGGMIAVHGEGRLRKLLHTQAGRLRLDEIAPDWPLGPEELARRHHASWAVCLEAGALDDIMDAFGARLRRGDDLTAQMLLFGELIRNEILAGKLDYWPKRLAGVPMPSSALVTRLLDAVVPARATLLLGLFDKGEFCTSIALRRHPREIGFDWILGPDEIRRDMGLLAGDFRRDYRHLARAVEKRTGHVSFGCFSEISTFQRLEVDPTPGAWARAVAIRDVILSPLPPALAIPLGVDAGRAALSAVRSLVERVDTFGVLSPATSRLKGLADNERWKTMFGFDPLELLRRLMSREL